MTEVLSSALEDLGFKDFTVDNLDEILPKIVSTISEDSNNPHFLQLLTLVFGQLAAQMSVDVLDFKLLKHVLPPTRTSFNSSLSKIRNLLEESEDLDEETAIHISESLQVCLDILSGYGELIEIVSKEVLQAESVDSLNQNLPCILVEAFSHCKDSESCYGTYFEESTIILTVFFKKSYEIQTKYYRLVEEKMTFSTCYEGDLECLLLVMESALKMAEIIISLDLKTSADQWKLYGKLYSKHAADLRNAIDTAQPLCLLISNFEQILSVLTKSQESTTEKQQLKLLKIANFLLKLIIKLCELSECNFRQGWKEVLHLLMLLNSCSRCQDVAEKFGEDLRRYIVVGATPLLTVLTKEDAFYKIFVSQKDSHQELPESQRVGLFFLCLSLMKQVVDRKLPASWNSVPFIEIVLNSYDSCGLLIDLNSQFEGNDAYSSLVSVSTAFMVATVDGSSLPNLENCLISKLFKGGLHTAVFVSDVFCLIGRLTSDEYCLHLATYLCEALKTWPRLSTDRPEHVVIGTLVRRLWCLLSPKSRDILLSKYWPPESIRVCYWFDGCGSYSENVVENLDNFFRNPSIASYVNMVASPPYIGNGQDGCSSGLSDAIVSHTLRTILYVGSLQGNSGDDQIWCHKLLLFSLKCILNFASTISPDQLTKVFEQLKALAVNCNESILFVIFLFLAKSTNILLRIQPSPRLIRAVSALLIRCMGAEDKNVETSTLRVLEALETSPGHKEIVMLVSSHNEKYLNAVNAHFHRTSPPAVSASLVEMLTSMPRLVHSCRRKSSKPVDMDDVPPPAKKAKTDTSKVCPRAASIQRLVSETKTLKGLHEQTRLSDELKQQLTRVVSELNSICEDTVVD